MRKPLPSVFNNIQKSSIIAQSKGDQALGKNPYAAQWSEHLDKSTRKWAICVMALKLQKEMGCVLQGVKRAISLKITSITVCF